MAATGKKKSTAGKAKSSTVRKTSSRQQTAKKEDTFVLEVILWIVVALSILLFISNFGFGGKIGSAVSGFFFGVFGLLAYIFPVFFLIGIFFAVSNKGSTVAVVKLVAGCLFVAFLCMFIQLAITGETVMTAKESYYYAKEHVLSGGIIGGALTAVMRPNFGIAGSYIIDIVVLIIALVLLTERSALRFMEKSSRKMYESAKNENERYQEYASKRREEREIQRQERARMRKERELELAQRKEEERTKRRMDKKANGVAIDTKIIPRQPENGSEEISELKAENYFALQNQSQIPVTIANEPEKQQEPEVTQTEETAASAFLEPELTERTITVTPTMPDISIAAEDEMPHFSDATLATLESVLREEMSGMTGMQASDGQNFFNDSTFFTENRPAAETGAPIGDIPANEAQASAYTEEAAYEKPMPQTDYRAGFHIVEASDNHTMTNSTDEPVIPDEPAIPDELIVLDEPIISDESIVSDESVTPDESGCGEPSETNITAYPEEPQADFPEPENQMQTAQMASALQPHSDVRRMSSQPKPSTAEDVPAEAIGQEIAETVRPEKPYVKPTVELLTKPSGKTGDSRQHLQETAMKLQQTLKNFGVNVTITNVSCGPSVTRYELQPESGVKVSKIVNLTDDIKLNLAAADIRMEAPIPGKAAIGIEVPNKENVTVSFRELVESEEFKKHPSKIAFAVGKDIGGKVIVSDIAKMPHLLIAGATGSGKSVCINTIIMSILYKADPKEVKLIMIDPKVVELSIYNGIPHLLIPVVTDPKKAAGALNWAVAEMTDRYNKFAEAGVRDMKGYNTKVDALPEIPGQPKPEKMAQIVIIVDELADLMMVASGDVEGAICRLAQLARAAGIHLIIATQRPSVNVITGLIKANMPSRIAFAVTSGIDSRTILDMVGAEKLLGKGDMLYSPYGSSKPTRVQGAFVSDEEVTSVVEYIKQENGVGIYNPAIQERVNSAQDSGNTTISLDSGSGGGDGRDIYFADAANLLIDKGKGSIGMLQRYFKIGFNRAARIMDQLEEAGIVGPEEGTKPRQVLMSAEQFEQYKEEYL